MNSIQTAFSTIKAEESLKENTKKYVCQELEAQKLSATNNSSSNIITVKGKSHMKKYLIAACISLFVVGSFSGAAYAFYKTPVSYVSLDINPSVELGINAFDQVVTVENTNEDGDIILADQDILNTNIEDAIETLIQSAIDNSYISEEGTSVISVIAESDNEETAQELQDIGEQSITDVISENDVEAIVYKDCSDLSLRTEAKELDISPGKLKHIKMLQALDSTITLDEYTNVNISDIMKKAHALMTEQGIKLDDLDTDDIEVIETLEKMMAAAETVMGNEKKAQGNTVQTKNNAEDKKIKAENKFEEKAANAESKAEEKSANAESKAVEKSANTESKAVEKNANTESKAVEKSAQAEQKAAKQAGSNTGEDTAVTKSSTSKQTGKSVS